MGMMIGTYTAGSMNYNEACERAEEQIRDDMKAGAVEQYIDGESAQQYLGELIRLNAQPKEQGESVSDWVHRIAMNIDAYIHNTIVKDVIENNVARVAQENSHD